MSLLAQLIEGQDIAVIAKNPKCCGLDFEDKVVVRFNNDGGRADIWCTSLHRGHNPDLMASCRLVVVPRPRDEIVILQDLKASEEWLDKPVEFFDWGPYLELCDKVQGRALTGTAFLHMLRGLDNFKSCTLYGFDAHLTPGAQTDSASVFFDHKPLLEHRYIRYLVLFDRRFKAGPHTRLFWPEIWWQIRSPYYFLSRHLRASMAYLRENGLARSFHRALDLLRERLHRPSRPWSQDDQGS